jgi:hypothetical protein
LGYKFKLANRLYANVYSGLNFDFYFLPQKGYDNFYFYLQAKDALMRRFNILLTNRASLQYFTKFNMGISVYGAYHAGFMQVWNSMELIPYHEIYQYPVRLLSRGSFWNFGIELGYKFSSKKEKKTK